MPKSRIMIQLDDETIERIDQARGAIPRAAWFRIAAANLLDQASVSQQEENRKVDLFPTSPRHRIEEVVKETSLEPAGDSITDDTEAVQKLQDKPQRRRKPKACKHTNQIRKLGRPYCTDCGEFV